MDMKTIGKWSYLVGLLLAIVTALIGYSAEWLALTLVGLAVLAGLLFGDTEKLVEYGVRYLTLVLVAAALDVIPFVGPYITSIAEAMVAFFGPAILTILLVFNYKQVVGMFQE